MHIVHGCRLVGSYILERHDDKVSPSITRVHLGEMAGMTCHTDGEVLWFLYNNEKFSDNVRTSGILNQHIEINKIQIDNIGTYCCYGYDKENNYKFVACSAVVCYVKYYLEIHAIIRA